MGRYVWIYIALKIGPICIDLLSLEDGADMFGFIEP